MSREARIDVRHTDQIVVSDNVTESTISAVYSTCDVASKNSCEVPASPCIGPKNINVVTIDQHVNKKAGATKEKDDVENG